MIKPFNIMDQEADYENFEEPNLEDFSEDQIPSPLRLKVRLQISEGISAAKQSFNFLDYHHSIFCSDVEHRCLCGCSRRRRF